MPHQVGARSDHCLWSAPRLGLGVFGSSLLASPLEGDVCRVTDPEVPQWAHRAMEESDVSVRCFDDVALGDELPVFERQTDLMNWNRFAAVNDEFAYIHMDDSAGLAAGQGGAFGMGALRIAFMLNSLRDWAG